MRHKTIQQVVDKLKDYPETVYEATDDTVTILPKSDKGFPVTLIAHGDSFMVYFDIWHTQFDSEEEALNCFTFGLSKECRLKRTKRGEKPYKWTVEYNDEGTWKEDSTTGLFNLALWKKSTVEYLQNDLIKADN